MTIPGAREVNLPAEVQRIADERAAWYPVTDCTVTVPVPDAPGGSVLARVQVTWQQPGVSVREGLGDRLREVLAGCVTWNP